MKKLLSFLLIISFVFTAFAVKPATNYSVAEFSGNATLEYKGSINEDADGKAVVKHGFSNSTEAKIKLNLLNGGFVKTRGKGLWGELMVEIEGADQENPGALSIGKSASVKTAKIHFVDGDVGVALNILTPAAKLGKQDLPSALPIWFSTSEINKSFSNGVSLEIRNYLADVDFIINSNGPKTSDAAKYTYAVKSVIKGFINTNIYADMALKGKDISYRLGGNHNFAINDKLYLKPAVDFTYEDINDLAVSWMAAGVLFGWGNTGVGFPFDDSYHNLAGYNKDNKFNEGFSVNYKTTLSKNDFENGVYGELAFGLFSNSLVEGLSTAAYYNTKAEEIGKGTLYLNAKYSKDFDVVGITLEGAAKTVAFKDFGATYEICFWNNKVIKNTNLWAKYQGNYKLDKDNNFAIGAKISL